MKYNLYAIKDNVLGAYQTPIPAQNDAVMERNLKIALMNPNSPLRLQKDSLSVYKLGSFDDATGELKSDIKVLYSTLNDLVSPTDHIESIVRTVVDELEREKEKSK